MDALVLADMENASPASVNAHRFRRVVADFISVDTSRSTQSYFAKCERKNVFR